MTQSGNRQNVSILCLTLGVVMLGFGMVMPSMPFMLYNFNASRGPRAHTMSPPLLG